METKSNWKAWLYLAPAIVLLGIFMLYPLIDVFIYSLEEDFKFMGGSESVSVGLGNYIYVLSSANFTSALQNTLVIVFVTVPLSTIIAILIAVGLNAIKPLRKVFQTIFFLPYVTNTLAVGLVFMVLFEKSSTNIGIINTILGWVGINPVDWLGGDATHFTRLCVLCFYTIWTVMPFKILVLVGSLQSVKKDYYDAAKIDHASKITIFFKITLPMISPMISYLVITGFIGAFKTYSDAVALFGENLAAVDMNTIVGYIYTELFSQGGYPSHAGAAAIILFAIVLTITCINLLVSKKTDVY